MTPIELLVWLTKSEQAKELEVVYQGENFSIKNTHYTRGKPIPLGSSLSFHALTGMSSESQVHLLRERKEEPPKPVRLTVEHWINWAKLLQLLEADGYKLPLVYHDKTFPDGTKYPAWRQLRDDYEDLILEAEDRYYSKAIEAAVRTRKRGVRPLAQTTKTQPDNAKNKARDRVMEKLAKTGEFSPQEVEAIAAALRDLKPAKPMLAQLVEEYMSDRAVNGIEELAIKILGATPSPKKHPLYRQVLELLEQILGGKEPDEGNEAYYLVMGQLAILLSSTDRPFWGDIDKLKDYCSRPVNAN